MSTISIVIIVLGILSTILFSAGFVRGVQNALNGFRKGSEEQFLVTDNAHWVAVGMSVIGAAFVIAAIGFIPAFVYAGPLLVLVSAAGTGLCFFIEKKEAPVAQMSTASPDRSRTALSHGTM